MMDSRREAAFFKITGKHEGIPDLKTHAMYKTRIFSGVGQEAIAWIHGGAIRSVRPAAPAGLLAAFE